MPYWKNMKILLDTNVIVDFLARRPTFFDDAQIIIEKCKNEKISGTVAVHTVSTLFYLLNTFLLKRQKIFFIIYSK